MGGDLDGRGLAHDRGPGHDSLRPGRDRRRGRPEQQDVPGLRIVGADGHAIAGGPGGESLRVHVERQVRLPDAAVGVDQLRDDLRQRHRCDRITALERGLPARDGEAVGVQVGLDVVLAHERREGNVGVGRVDLVNLELRDSEYVGADRGVRSQEDHSAAPADRPCDRVGREGCHVQRHLVGSGLVVDPEHVTRRA